MNFEVSAPNGPKLQPGCDTFSLTLGGSSFQKFVNPALLRTRPLKVGRKRLEAETHFQCAIEAPPGELLQPSIQ